MFGKVKFSLILFAIINYVGSSIHNDVFAGVLEFINKGSALQVHGNRVGSTNLKGTNVNDPVQIKKSNLVLNKIGKTTIPIFKILLLLFSVFIIVLTVVFYRSRFGPVRFMTTTRLSVMDKMVQQACRYIEKNYSSMDLSIQDICDYLVTGPAFLNALFEKELGMSIDGFICQVRINHLKILLNSDEQLSIEELALLTGFADPQSCLKAFFDVTGVDFGKYKKSISTSDGITGSTKS